MSGVESGHEQESRPAPRANGEDHQVGQVEEMAEGDQGGFPVRELREVGERQGGTPGPQGRQSKQLELGEPPYPVPLMPHEQGPQERGDSQLALWLPGDPVPAPRPRVTRWGTYFPRSYAEWLERARSAAREGWRGPLVAAPEPVYVFLKVWCARPKSHYGTGRNSGTVKPKYLEKFPVPLGDVDNYAKGPLDALTGVTYEDDTQVCGLLVKKRWLTDPEGQPGIMVEVWR